MGATKPKKIKKTATQIKQKYDETIAKIDKQISNKEKLISKLQEDNANLRNKKFTITDEYLKARDNCGEELPPEPFAHMEHATDNIGDYS